MSGMHTSANGRQRPRPQHATGPLQLQTDQGLDPPNHTVGHARATGVPPQDRHVHSLLNRETTDISDEMLLQASALRSGATHH